MTSDKPVTHEIVTSSRRPKDGSALSGRQFGALLRRAARLSAELQGVQKSLTDAFIHRYGATYSDVDADELIDVLDYGGGTISVAIADAAMARRGCPKRAA